MRLNGSQILSRALHDEGVEVIFGIPGGTIMPLYDEMHKHPMRHLLVRHEQACRAHGGWLRARQARRRRLHGDVEPGATNLVTGILNAHMDSAPLVAITVNVPSAMIGSDGFQEADISGITIPVTKQNYFVRHTRDLAKVIKRGVLHRPERPRGSTSTSRRTCCSTRSTSTPRGGRSARLPAQLRRQHGPDPQGGPPDRAGESRW